MAQTDEFVRDNIVRIVDGDCNTCGTGFFVQKEYCVTCHHNIWKLDEIWITQDGEKKYRGEWSKKYSCPDKDIAILKIIDPPSVPLECKKEAYQEVPVFTRGFPIEDEDRIVSGRIIEGKLGKLAETLGWEDEGISGKNEWNKKPSVRVPVFSFLGNFSVGFSGAPVCYNNDNKVLGMFESKDDQSGYVIPIEQILGPFSEKTPDFSTEKPLNFNEVLEIGNKFFSDNKYEKAIQEYKQILSDPNFVVTLTNMARALQFQKMSNESSKYLDIVLEMDPTYQIAWNGKGNALSDLGKREEAIKCFDRAIKIDPNYSSPWHNKGNALSNLGKNEEAIKCYERAIEIDPNDAYPWVGKGNTLSELGKREEVIKCFDRAIEIDPNFPASWNGKGITLSNLGKNEEAIKCFNRAIKIDPNYLSSWHNKGVTLGHLGKNEEAIKCYDRALEIDPNKAHTLYNKGTILRDLGKEEEAKTCFKKAEELGYKI